MAGDAEIGGLSGSESLFAYNSGRSSYGQLDLYNVSTGNVTLTTTFGSGNILLTPGATSGKVGIASTTPWRKFSVTGTVGFDGLTAGAGAGSLCLSANKEITYSDNAGCTGSSLRFKHDVATLTMARSIPCLRSPVSFVYNDDIGIQGEQVGFIAEEVFKIDPRLVTLDASSIPNNVKYANFTAILARAMQEIASITGAFKDALIAWLGSANERPLARSHAGNLHDAIGRDGGVRERGPARRDPGRNKRRRSNSRMVTLQREAPASASASGLEDQLRGQLRRTTMPSDAGRVFDMR